MKIIALDANALTFDGLSWQPLADLGEFTAYEKSTPQEGIERCLDAEAVIVNKFLINKDFLSKCTKIKYVGITATGTNNVDLELCRSKGITVTNVPAYSTLSVAQLVFAFVNLHFNRLRDYQNLSHQWHESQNFCLPLDQHRELSALSICIIGSGAIGSKIADIAKAYEMKVLMPAIPGRSYKENRISLEQALAEADIVSLNCPLSPLTDKIINKKTLSIMKPSSILINTSRGPLVNEEDLIEALKNKTIAAAYLDVLEKEPPQKNHRLIENAFVTPHIAWATVEARTRLMRQTAENLKAFINNKALNICN